MRHEVSSELPIDDAWTRDSGPIFVRDGGTRRIGVDFRFNSWSERYLPYDKDAAMTRAALELLGFERRASELVLEGGAITVDGEGTLITTEQCVLNANRNPAWSKAAVEAELRAQLGVETIIWLPYGSRLGVTDGHVDGVCVFAGPGRVLLRVPDDPSDPDYDRMRENRRVLADARDARGRELEVIELPHHPVAEVDGVPARVIGYGGGGVHCITQQVPRA